MKQKNIEDIYELSPMQQGMLFHTLVAPSSEVYFEQFCCVLQTQLDVLAFKNAWQRVVDRYPILRTSFYWENLDKPYQVVHQQVDLLLEFLDWRKLSSQEQQKQLVVFLTADRKRGFELSQPPLMRIALIQLGDETYQFVFSFHHILMDGWSITWLWKEFYEFYNAFCKGQDLSLERPCPYRKYITWLQQQDLSKAEAFWRETLKGFTIPTPLMVDKPLGKLLSEDEDYDKQHTQISATMTAALNSFARKHQLTLNVLLKGAWALLLSRYSAESDIVFGATSSGRPAALANAESMMGLFISTLPLRVQVDNNTFLLPWLKKLQAKEVQMRQYEYSSLMQIQQWSEIPRGLPLFESLLVFNNYLVDSTQEKLAQSMYIRESRLFERTNYPLTIVVEPRSDLLNLSIGYDTLRFNKATISRMLGHLETLLKGMVANPDRQLWDLPFLTSQESEQLLLEWNNTQTEYPQEQCIHELFEAQVQRTPDAIAVVFEDEQLTYCQLNARVNQLAHYLQKLGVEPEVLVGICMERSLDMAIGLLGILKAGGAYIPLDLTYPKERLAFMLENSQPSVLLTQQHLVETLPTHKAKVVCLDSNWELFAQQRIENPGSNITPDNLAYVIYTSGSTGQPKGVFGLHRGAINRFHWMWQNYPFVQGEICCHKTSLNFVDSVWEIFGPLLQGVPTVIVPNEVVKNPQQFVATLARNNVTRLVLIPSLLRILLNTYTDLESRLPHLKFWVSSGEALSIDLLVQFRQRLPDSTLLNLYGSSEVSADVTCYSLSPHELLPECVSIGRPIANTQIYVLDARKQPVPIGVPGELHISGDGLARGYFNRPELTAEKFIPNPFSDRKSAACLYKTGDLVRYLPNGEIEYIGRIDHQVKVRGFRIELGEIEAVISQHPKVRETVVAVRSDSADSQRLVAYVVAQKQTLTMTELRDFLESKLPNYMIPAAFVMLEALPLTPNGKVDRKALRTPDTARPELEAVYQPPQNEVEKAIANIWQESLHVKDVGIHDNFFELGGHSLLLVQVYSKLQKIFQRDFSLVEMFQYPTISRLATYLGQESSEQQSFTQHSHRPESRVTSVQRRKQARQEHRAAQKGISFQ